MSSLTDTSQCSVSTIWAYDSAYSPVIHSMHVKKVCKSLSFCYHHGSLEVIRSFFVPDSNQLIKCKINGSTTCLRVLVVDVAEEEEVVELVGALFQS